MIITILDNRNSISLRSSQHMKFKDKLFGYKDEEYFKYTEDVFTFIKDGYYRISFVINGTARGTIGSLTMDMIFNDEQLKNTSRRFNLNYNDSKHLNEGFSGLIKVLEGTQLKFKLSYIGLGGVILKTTGMYDAILMQIELCKCTS